MGNLGWADIFLETLFRALSSTADGACVVNGERRILYWNRAAQEILEYESRDVVGRPCHEIWPGWNGGQQATCSHFCAVVSSALEGQVTPNHDVSMLTRSGETRWVNVSCLVFPVNGQALPVVVYLFRDVTQEKHNQHFKHQVLGAVQSLGQGDLFEVTPPGPARDLTDREYEILLLLTQGLSTRDMAQALSISASTVRNHVQSVLEKLEVHSRLEAVAFAFENGLVTSAPRPQV